MDTRNITLAAIVLAGLLASGDLQGQKAERRLRELVLSHQRVYENDGVHSLVEWNFQTNGTFSVVGCAKCKQNTWGGGGKWSETSEGFLRVEGRRKIRSADEWTPFQVTLVGAEVLSTTSEVITAVFDSLHSNVTFQVVYVRFEYADTNLKAEPFAPANGASPRR
jgi:hypothetical protein